MLFPGAYLHERRTGGRCGLAFVVLSPADGGPAGSQGAAMAPSARERSERLIVRHTGHLVLVVQPPADHGTVRLDPAGMEIARADPGERGIRRRRYLAVVVVHAAPTHRSAGGGECAGVSLSGGYRREGRICWRGRLVLLIITPTDRRTIALQRTGMNVSCAHGLDAIATKRSGTRGRWTERSRGRGESTRAA